MFSLMTLESDFVVTDPENERLIFDDGFVLPFKELGPPKNAQTNDEDEFIFNYEFVVKEIFEEADAKYSTVFGNVAFVDCNYIFNTLIESI